MSDGKEPNVSVRGTCIVVIDNGFVNVGDVTICEGPFGAEVVITRSRNLRKWGTTQGLGELRVGPTGETITDEEGTTIVPYNRVVKIIPATGW